MKIWMKITPIVMAIALTACNMETEPINTTTETTVEAGFSVPCDISRTSIDPDGRTTRWNPGDKIALWAMDANGDMAISNATFMLRYFSPEYDHAYFAGNIAPMAEGDYTYLMSYPLPTSTNGTEVTYNVAATQSGKYDGKYDIMVAEPTVNGSITGGQRIELNTVMHHQMHAIKITIPEGRNLFGYRFTNLEITFPQDVVGDITLDINNPEAAPIYSNTSNIITVENAEGFDAGDEIWVFVLPGTVEGDVSYEVEGQGRISVTNSYPLSRNMEPGHITPINMATPEVYKYTSFVITQGQNNLGEDMTHLSIFTANGEEIYSSARRDDNTYTIGFEGEKDFSSWQNSTLKLVIESEHTIIEQSVNIGTVNAYTTHVLQPFDIPYLFAEDFNSVGAFTDGHADPANGFSGDSKNYSSSFSDHTSNSRMQGWSGGRYQCESGSIRMCCRSECGLKVITHYRGRMDTAPLALLKDGASVAVNVTFNYGGSIRTYGLFEAADILMYFGSTTSSGVISPSTDISNTVLNGTAVSDIAASFTAINTTANATISDCTNSTRLSWIVGSNAPASWGGNGNQWLYIDNIKVQIAQ